MKIFQYFIAPDLPHALLAQPGHALYLVIVITTGILLLALHSNMLNIRVIIGDRRGVRRLGERESIMYTDCTDVSSSSSVSLLCQSIRNQEPASLTANSCLISSLHLLED